MGLAITYVYHQVDLACIDTIGGDYSDYRVCLTFAMTSSSVSAVRQMFAMNGALAFEDCERMTRDELLDWWLSDEQRRAA